MKGLLIKDYYCMKKTLKLIILVSFVTIFLAVLFILSAKYGNISKSITEVASENKMTEEEFYSFYKYAIWMILFIPMAFMANVLDCFKEDHRVGFAKTLFSMPVKTSEIVGARYLAVLVYGLIGCISSIVAALCVSIASDQMQFVQLLSILFFFFGIMLIYVAFIMPFVYKAGAEKSDLIMIVTAIFVIALALVGVILVFNDKEAAVKKGFEASSQLEIDIETIKQTVDYISSLLMTKGAIIIIIAMSIFGVSYFSSVKIVKKRRGGAI